MVLEFCNYREERTYVSSPACVDEAFYDIQEYAGRRRFTPRFYHVEQMDNWWKVDVGAREEYFCIREYEPEDMDELMDVLEELN